MLGAPVFDVGPVKALGLLHLQYGNDIREVLCPLASAAPAQFLDDDVLGTRKVGSNAWLDLSFPSPRESGMIMSIIAQV